LNPDGGRRPALARSTWSDALASTARLAVLVDLLSALRREAVAVLPDRLDDIPALGTRPVHASGGTYQEESVQACRPLGLPMGRARRFSAGRFHRGAEGKGRARRRRAAA